MLMPTGPAPWLQLLALVTIARGSADTDDDQACECFLTNGSVPMFLTSHMFFDFRSLSKYAGVPDPIKHATDAASAPPSSDYFKSSLWKEVWDIQTWDNSYGPGEGLSDDATYLMVNSRSNVFIEENKDRHPASDTYLTLRTRRLESFQTASEFQSIEGNFRHLSLRMLARTTGSAGAVTGLFTYRDATGKLSKIQESDIEILTSGPRDRIQYTNQPSYTDSGSTIPAATRNASTPDWSRWAVHRLDWTPHAVLWYLDGELVSRIAFQTPRDPVDVHFSAWGNGGSWSGTMERGEEARQQIQWIEVLFNVSDENVVGAERRRREEKKKCAAVCSVDEHGDAGRARVLWESAGTHAAGGDYLGWKARCMSILVAGSLLAL